MAPTYKFWNKDPDMVPEQSSIYILDRKSAICIDKNIKNTKHTRHIHRIRHFYEMANNKMCTRQCGVREIWNYQTLVPRLLGKMNWILDYHRQSTDHLYKRGDRMHKWLKNNMFWMTWLDCIEDLIQWVWNAHISLEWWAWV